MNTAPPASPAAPRLSLRANVSWTFAGYAVYAASQFAMLMVLAKVGTPAMVGQFALGLAIGTPVIMFTNLGMRRAQATDVRREYSFAQYLGTRLLATTLGLLVIIGLVLAAHYPAATAWTVILLGLAKGCEAVSDVFYGLLQMHERMDRIAKSMLIKGPLSLLALGLVVTLTHSVVWGTLALALVWGILLVCFDARAPRLLHEPSVPWGLGPMCGTAVRALNGAAGRHALGQLVVVTLPLGLVETLDALNPNLPRYVLQHTQGESAVGLYSAIAAFMQVGGSTVMLAFAQAATPRLARLYVEDFRGFLRLCLRLLLLAIGFAVVGIVIALLWGRPLLALVYRPEYAVHAEVLVWIMAAAGVWYVAGFLSCALTAARAFRVQVVIFSAMVAATGLGCLLLIPRYGLRGAAWALGIGMLVRLVGYMGAVGVLIRRRAALPSPLPADTESPGVPVAGA
jgi:O-antigen/teichoic acid export membrane protein